MAVRINHFGQENNYFVNNTEACSSERIDICGAGGGITQPNTLVVMGTPTCLDCSPVMSEMQHEPAFPPL